MNGDALFREGGGSYNSHEMILSSMPGMGLLISPSIRTYNATVGIWQTSIPMYANMFWVTLARDSNSFKCGVL